MWYGAVSRSASPGDYRSEKNVGVVARNEIYSLKKNVGMIRERYASLLIGITKKRLLKHHTDGSNLLLSIEVVPSLGDLHRGFCFSALFESASKLRIILTSTPRGCKIIIFYLYATCFN